MVIAEQVKDFFHREGIHSTTVQPEFIDASCEVSYYRFLLDFYLFIMLV